MRYTYTILVGILGLISSIDMSAQNGQNATGGEANGVGGTASYSVGQVVYNTYEGTNGSLSEGVQQPYEISTTVGISNSSIQLEMSVYPNPTTNFLTLTVADYTNMNYQLYDVAGKVIENGRITDMTTLINIADKPQSIYFLNVTKDSQLIKTFKIIKN